MGSIEAAAAGQLKFGFCLGGNLYGSNPDAAFAAEALGKLDMVVYLNTTLNTGHAHGLAQRDDHPAGACARRRARSRPRRSRCSATCARATAARARHAGPRSEVEIVADLARRVLGNDGPIDWNEMATHCADSRGDRPDHSRAGRRSAEIDRTKQEFQISGRRLDTPRFPTPNGRAQLHVHDCCPSWRRGQASCG